MIRMNHFKSVSFQIFQINKMKSVVLGPLFFMTSLSYGQALPSRDACLTSVNPPAILTGRPQMKFFTGHYIHIGQRPDPSYFQTVINEIKTTKIKGLVRRYTWSDLDFGGAGYRLTQIENDLNIAASNSKKLFIFVQFKYRNLADGDSVPAYLKDPAKANYYTMSGSMGTVPNWSREIVVQSFLKLLKEIAVRFDSHPALAGITFNETASSATMTAAQREAYMLGLVRVDKAATCLFRETPVIQLTNHPKQYLGTMTTGYRSHGVGIGAPDVFSYSENDDIWNASYPYFTQLQYEVPRAALVAGNNYMFKTYKDEKNGYNKELESASTSVSRIFGIANDTLKSNFIFWHRAKGDDKYYLAVKAKVQNESTPLLRSACPSTYKGGCRN